jgi:hypothetical protein
MRAKACSFFSDFTISCKSEPLPSLPTARLWRRSSGQMLSITATPLFLVLPAAVSFCANRRRMTVTESGPMQTPATEAPVAPTMLGPFLSAL